MRQFLFIPFISSLFLQGFFLHISSPKGLTILLNLLLLDRSLVIKECVMLLGLFERAGKWVVSFVKKSGRVKEVEFVDHEWAKSAAMFLSGAF